MVATVASSSQSFAPLSPNTSPSPRLRSFVKEDSLPPPQVQQSANGSARISPAVLFIVVILAVIFFISGLLHLLVRLLLKKQHGRGDAAPSPHHQEGGPDAAVDRQLQQLFDLHDSGLDQEFIDALPVFAYRDIIGGDKEPFDCAVCLCEFDGEDRLRLLPVCGHAFHLHCIDTWLLSNSTCPLCRDTLFVPGLTIDNLMFDFDEKSEEGPSSSEFPLPRDEEQPVAEKRVFPVRLGKFKNVGNHGAIGCGVRNGNAAGPGTVRSSEAGESSSSLDTRRCFSMGTYQYVLGASELRVSLQPDPSRNGVGGRLRGRRATGMSSINTEIMEGKRICRRNKGESFSVSKIWQWSAVKGKLPAGSENCSETGSLPWMKRDATGDKSNA